MAGSFPNPDFRDLLRAFAAAKVRFLIVGAYAVGAHGHVRATGDLDLWIEATHENARRAMRALSKFGAPLFDLSEEDLTRGGTVFQVGLPPSRIDILTEVSGLTFAAAWKNRIAVPVQGIKAHVIGIDELLVNKRAVGRQKDRADLAALKRIARRRAALRRP